MNVRDKDFNAAAGGGPGGAADAGERNLAPATLSPHAPAGPRPGSATRPAATLTA